MGLFEWIHESCGNFFFIVVHLAFDRIEVCISLPTTLIGWPTNSIFFLCCGAVVRFARWTTQCPGVSLIENYECHSWSHCKYSPQNHRTTKTLPGIISMNKLQTLPAHRTFSSDLNMHPTSDDPAYFTRTKIVSVQLFCGCRFVVSLSFLFSDSFKCVLIYLWRSLVPTPKPLLTQRVVLRN